MATIIRIARYRIQIVGGSYCITIPPVWREDLNIKKGDSIEIFRNEKDELILRPVESGKEKEGGQVCQSS